jgi:hypothetical protein
MSGPSLPVMTCPVMFDVAPFPFFFRCVAFYTWLQRDDVQVHRFTMGLELSVT